MTAPGETNIASAPSGWAIWLGVLGAPAVWGLQLSVGYAMPPSLCHLGSRWPEWLLHIICLALALIGAGMSYRQYASIGGKPDEPEGGPVARRRFLGALGTVVGLLFAMVIIAQSLPSFFFDPCWS